MSPISSGIENHSSVTVDSWVFRNFAQSRHNDVAHVLELCVFLGVVSFLVSVWVSDNGSAKRPLQTNDALRSSAAVVVGIV